MTLPIINDCDGCGVCCLHMGFPAFNLEPEQLRNPHQITESEVAGLGVAAAADLNRWLAMPDSLRTEILDAIDRDQPPEPGQLDGPCIWFDDATTRCRHHQHRPQVCRDFPVGGNQCRAWRDHYSI